MSLQSDIQSLFKAYPAEFESVVIGDFTYAMSCLIDQTVEDSQRTLSQKDKASLKAHMQGVKGLTPAVHRQLDNYFAVEAPSYKDRLSAMLSMELSLDAFHSEIYPDTLTEFYCSILYWVMHLLHILQIKHTKSHKGGLLLDIVQIICNFSKLRIEPDELIKNYVAQVPKRAMSAGMNKSALMRAISIPD